MGDILHTSTIQSVRFHLVGTDEIRKDSRVQITSPDLFRNNEPYPNGVYDAHTGTSAHEYRCQTCYNKKANCPGHPGHIELKYPVWNPLGVVDGRKWLKLICFKCGTPVIPPGDWQRFPRTKRLDEASKLARTPVPKTCPRCQEVHPIIKRKDKKEPLSLVAEYYVDRKLDRTEPIYPHIAELILSRISMETVISLGKQINSHPRNFILRAIKVPPITIRPDVKKMGGQRNTNDDLTTALQIMIKKSDAMPAVIPPLVSDKLAAQIYELNNTFYDFVKATGEGSMNSIARRLKGKQGRFRKNMLGKRVFNMARSTIIGNTQMKIDEVGVPLVFARTIQYEETVQEFNKKQLLEYVQNGTKRYPGATKVIKRSSGKSYDVDNLRDIDLEVGDKVHRDMIDGDPVNFNRQPSLKVSNISTHKAVIIRDPSIKTLIMNVIACILFDADFDGDQMNLILSAGIDTRCEIAELSSVSNWFISHTSSGPHLGQVDDSVIGSAELTRSNVRLDKYHAMMLCQNTTILPSFGHLDVAPVAEKSAKIPTRDPVYATGRECVSMLLAETPINFSRATEWYDPNLAQYMNYDPDEIRVNIVRGKLMSGILDKKNVGKNASGGIYHIIANDFGATKALEVMYNMQQMAISYLSQIGYTIGLMDLMISRQAKTHIDEIASDIINKSRLITEELHNGEIIPPIGKTIKEFYEERQINTVSIFDDFIHPIMTAINPYTNNLFKLIKTGSKGKFPDMLNMMSSIGQKQLNGERPREKFGLGRTLPYFGRFDASPESRGYITNSYLSGMTTSEYIFNAMAARFDLITKALSTSITGEQMRKSVKNLESIVINNHRWSTKGANIIQFAYGDDFLDPRRVERVKFPTVMISDEELKAKFSHPDYPEEFKLIQSDRRKYREIFLKQERFGLKDFISDERNMPVAIERIINNVMREYGSENKSTPDGKTLNSMVATVRAMCNGIPYVLVNEIQQRRGMKLPETLMHATWLLTMLLRSYLHPKALVALGMTPELLQIITDRVRLQYARALIEPGTSVGIIAAQSFSAPLTQYMLDAHHRSATGGTSKSSIVTVKEIMGAREVSALKAPSMTIPVLPEYAGDQKAVQEIANNIEMMLFRQFVTSWHIYFEKYGEPQHSTTIGEIAMFNDFRKANPLLTPPGDLIKWCIRFVINKTSLILKNMSLELIIARLRDTFPDMFIVYSQENSPQVVIRAYMRGIMFKSAVTLDDILLLKGAMLNVIIRGINGIINTTVTKLMRNQIMPDGSIKRDDSKWCIVTLGTNLRGVLGAPRVLQSSVQTDAIQEVAEIFGIEAARQKIVSSLANLAISNINQRHYMIYADEMTFTGNVTSIESSGLRTRETSNVLLRAGASSPMAALEEAAINSMSDTIGGVTAPFLIGAVPISGSIYNSFHVNREFVKKNVKRPDDLLAELF